MAVGSRIGCLLVKPVSALCNLDCEYCFYLDREADPYRELPARIMNPETLQRLVDSYLFYSYPESTFAFQGGEPTLAGLDFFRRLGDLEKRCGRNGQAVSNSIQTNGVLLTRDWCQLFREFNCLVGISLDGPEAIHDHYRTNKGKQGTWKKVIEAVELLQRERVDYNVLCVVSKANTALGREVYRYFRKLGIAHMQFIPLAEFQPDGAPMPFAVTGEEYGRFLCAVFDLWWPERRTVRVRFFDNLAEALAGQKPSACTMRETCDSYAVVEYNGDVYPCDFFVRSEWKLGNVNVDSWPEIARKQRRLEFAACKAIAHPECQACEHATLCRGGCPKDRHSRHGRFEDLDWFCSAYKMIFGKAAAPLRRDVERLRGK